MKVKYFTTKYEAYLYIKNINDPSIIELDKSKGLLKAKAIITPEENNFFYPAWVLIDIESGGELYSTYLYTEDGKQISEDVEGVADNIYPFEYETISLIPGDFHQTNPILSHHAQHLSNAVFDVVVSSTFQISAKIRSYFSIQHLLSAVTYSEKIKNIESNLNQKSPNKINDGTELVEHRAYCVSAIFSIVAFLEASINEFFMDAYDNRNGIVADLKDEEVFLLKNMWEMKIPKTANYPIIEKYQIALNLLNREKFDIGINPVQNINILIQLRNALVHFEPDWEIMNEKASQEKLSKKLDNKFKMNNFLVEYSPNFPDKYLSGDMCEWAISSSLSFTDLFFDKLKIIPYYEKIRNLIKKDL